HLVVLKVVFDRHGGIVTYPMTVTDCNGRSAGFPKSPPASFSLRSEAQRTEAYASPLRSLRPCWTDFLSILRRLLFLSQTRRPVRLCCIELYRNGFPVAEEVLIE